MESNERFVGAETCGGHQEYEPEMAASFCANVDPPRKVAPIDIETNRGMFGRFLSNCDGHLFAYLRYGSIL